VGRESEAASINLSLTKQAILPIIQAALKEDIGPRDLTTSALIPKDQQTEGEIVIRQEGVVAGLPVAEWTFNAVDPRVRFKPMVRDGETVHAGKAVAFIEGPARGILMAERTALNFFARMSGVASLTRAFVEKVRRTRAQILDTRKTTPTLRILEKYAVAAGGGVPHRMGLYDQVLIKDNHLKLVAAQGGAGSPIERAVALARSQFAARRSPPVIEVEVTHLQEFRQALSAKADIILLDNMELPQIQEAVRLRNAVSRSKKGPRVLLEVSGGVTLETVERIAAAGADRISVGSLTHSAPALDVALELLA